MYRHNITMFGRNRINTTQKKLYNGGFTDFACFLILDPQVFLH